jgi:hypothetical protein
MAFAVFFLAEYANMILVSTLTAILFLGGWLSPVGFLPDGILWLFLKISAVSVRLPLGSRYLPSLSLRPDHASGLESVHPAVPDMAGCGRHLDDVALEHLEVRG